MKFPHTVFLCFFTVFPAMHSYAQSDPEYKMEIGVGVGMMNYEGDFNGSIMKCGQMSAALLYRYLINPRSALRASLDYGRLKASSKAANTSYPDYGTGLYDAPEIYDFSNSLVDIDVVYEYNFWPYGTGKDYRGAKRLTPYVLLGAGLTFAKNDDGSVFTGNVPLGIGIKYKVAKRVNLNVEWAMHFSLNDNLDGVKDPYYIESSGMFKNADCYSQLMINLTYSFKEKCRVCHNDKE